MQINGSPNFCNDARNTIRLEEGTSSGIPPSTEVYLRASDGGAVVEQLSLSKYELERLSLHTQPVKMLGMPMVPLLHYLAMD